MEQTASSTLILGRPSSSVAAKAVLLVLIVIYLVLRLRPKRRNILCGAGAGAGACSSAATPLPLPPGPVPWPVVGNLPEMMLNKPAFRWIHHMMKEMGTDIACVRLGSVHVVSITCPKIAREVLKKQDANFASRPLTFASATFSGGYRNAVLSPFGDQWKKMRRVLTSEIVCPSRHRWLHDRRADEADNLTRYVHNLITKGSLSSSSSSGGAAVDVRHVSRHYCGNVIRRLLFGSRYFGEPRLHDDGGPGPLEVEHMDAMFTSLGLLYAFCVSDYLPWLRGLDLDGHEKMVKEANATINRLHDTVIDERWRRWKSGERKDIDDFLDVLITLKDSDGNPLLTLQEVKAQSQDITFAAVDNPSNAIEWALAEMANAPEVMAKAVEEMDRVVGRERLVQESDIPQLIYTKACVREAFRLHPVAPFNVPHVALSDTTVAGYRVPKGSHVILSRIGLGRNPAVWDEPLRFKPERHINMAAGSDGGVALTENELRFISFSTGRRGCVAASLGTAMCMMLFGRLIQGFTWSKPTGVAAIDLSEAKHDVFLAKSLVLHADLRLRANLYPATTI
ncbi:tyrosine N-monooxygenase-like [Aegilops tauschii subsp. strangulata]|uniref:Tyrosine N-monooxygenase n=1 Tax=Aegilops tauschii subsp. strangulata TaxID=200361 RepID=A0A453R9F7_AEGTS|nr:tyrosine N-monooxygenase-like [Aegilops tauschii subsp. strangulata]